MDAWKKHLADDVVVHLGPNPRLYRSKTEEEVQKSDVLTADACYGFSLSVSNTLYLCILLRDTEFCTEEEILSDYPFNMTPHSHDEIAEKWRQVGFDVDISSYGGRGIFEPELMVGLAAALGEVFRGYVIIENSVFSLCEGIYTPEHFTFATTEGFWTNRRVRAGRTTERKRK